MMVAIYQNHLLTRLTPPGTLAESAFSLAEPSTSPILLATPPPPSYPGRETGRTDLISHPLPEGGLIMDVSTHETYLTHLRQRLMPLLEDPAVTANLEVYAYECVTLVDLNLDAQRDALEALSCPTGQGAPKDPGKMLQAFLLMTLRHETGSPDGLGASPQGR